MSVAQTPVAEESTKEAAYVRVFNNVHVPVLLHRLAARGYEPKTAEERQLFIDISTKLATAKANGQIPATGEPKLSKFAAAAAALDNVLNTSEAAHEQQLKQATQQLLQDESIYAATVALLEA